MHPAKATWRARQRRLGNVVGDADDQPGLPDEEDRLLVAGDVEMLQLTGSPDEYGCGARTPRTLLRQRAHALRVQLPASALR